MGKKLCLFLLFFPIARLETSLEQESDPIYIIDGFNYNFTCRSEANSEAKAMYKTNKENSEWKTFPLQDSYSTGHLERKDSGFKICCISSNQKSKSKSISRELVIGGLDPEEYAENKRYYQFVSGQAEPIEVKMVFESYPIPKPDQITWNLADFKLHPGETSYAGDFKANTITQLEIDKFEVSLSITDKRSRFQKNQTVSAEAEAEVAGFSISVSNDFSEDGKRSPKEIPFTVNFVSATSNTTTIIVILLLLLVVSFLVFLAYKKKRFCFKRKKQAEVEHGNYMHSQKPLLNDERDEELLIGSPDFIKYIEGKMETKRFEFPPTTFYALSQTSQVFGISFTPNTINSAMPTQQIKHILDLMKPRNVENDQIEIAEHVFHEAMTYIDSEKFEQACQKFEKVKEYAAEGISKKAGYELKVYLSRLLIFTQLMVETYDKETDSFIPLEKLELAKKNLCGDLIKNRCNTLRKDTKKNQDELDSFLRSVYPILAICCYQNVPAKYWRSCPATTLATRYIPCDEYSAALLPLGFLVNNGYKEMNVFIWKEHKGNQVRMRIGQRVFHVPNTNTEEVNVQFKQDQENAKFYQCYFSHPNDSEPVRCKFENRLPHGIKTVRELMDQMSRNRILANGILKAASRDPYKLMKKLGHIYLQEIEMDINEENESGDNLLYLVAYSGQLEALKNLLDSGASIRDGKEPTLLRIAGEGDPSRHREVLAELKQRHINAGTLDIANEKNQTALHKAVISNNTMFVQDLKDCIDHSIEDVEGKKAKDYANPELKKILVGVEEDRGFCL